MTNSDYLTVQIGNKIKSIRKEIGWKVGELADKSGISIAMISKIENGRVIPTIPSLLQIIQTLNLNIGDFFSDLKSEDEFKGYIFRKRSDYTAVNKEEESIGYEYELILNFPLEKSSMEISLLTLKSQAQRASVSTSGFEYIYILKGNISFELGSEVLELDEGDSLFFDGNIPHVPQNKSSSDAVLLVVYFITMN
ncbi:transcriptional regulator with XRE-family HTH domain [Algoriphagus iocasae]|jgi:transcriptional regulator with XRE-family HTH domain|uniref:Transcriptional regulator with XRE-family HTH domain n=1 Tax=Algoriphagus iocasae TaxID=1836499 RepID=A0A841N2V8_9BACT|nr:XRE family transcriptional regulator [Algoriphagus iocasae]MBB6328975.1 transcriptional regulator with XRE-family HTH domain [Algoriphagus iocasae]